MPKLPNPISQAKTIIERRLPGGEEKAIEHETAYHGLIEDYIVLSGRTMNDQQILIDGRPIRTSLNAEEIKGYIADHMLTIYEERTDELEKKRESLTHARELPHLEEEFAKVNEKIAELKGIQTAALEIEKEGLQQEIALLKKDSDEAKVKEIDGELKEIREEAKELNEKLGAATIFAEAYVFDDFLVVHLGHVERSLREYGGLHEPTLQTHVVGNADLLPEPIDFGTKKLKIVFFDPIDFRERETFCPKCEKPVTLDESGEFECESGHKGTRAEVRGGEIRATFLTHEQKMALQGWLESSVRVASVIRLLQKVKSLTRDKKGLEETVQTMHDQLGTMRRRVRGLEGVAGTQMASFSISKVLYTVLLGQFGFPIVFFVIGLFIALSIGGITVSQPAFNETSHIQTGINTITTPSPFAMVLPGIMTLAGVFIAILFSHRYFRGQA